MYLLLIVEDKISSNRYNGHEQKIAEKVGGFVAVAMVAYLVDKGRVFRLFDVLAPGFCHQRHWVFNPYTTVEGIVLSDLTVLRFLV